MSARFCIVIPTFNSLVTLPAAVESALAQEFADYTVVVSDNGSTDGSADYLRSLDDARLRVALNAETVSKTRNWNRAFLVDAAPDAEFLVMLHSDDVLYPGALREIAAAIDRQPGGAVYFGNHDTLSIDGATITTKKPWPFPYRLGSRRFDRLQVLTSAVTVVATTFRAELVRAVGGFDVRYDFYQDMEFFHALGRLGPAVYFPARVGLYRDTPLRPKNRCNFACEQARWVQERAGCWPRPIAAHILRAWVSNEFSRLQRDVPEFLPAYEECLTSLGIDLAAVRNGAVKPSHVDLHRFYKLWVSAVARA